jgi:3-oxoacyl-[acyl-carrier protein] reductase
MLFGQRDRFAADEAVEQIRSAGGAAVVVAGDVGERSTADAMVETALREFGQLDIVVNNAGYTWDGIAHRMSDDQFRAMLEIHTVVPFRVLRAAAPALREAGKKDRDEGREVFRKVVNVTSISGTLGNVGQVNYSAAKAGLVGLTKTLAREWGPFKVNVNAAAFGFIDTRLTASSDEGATIERNGHDIKLGIPAQMRDIAATIIPLGRPGTPEEAAGAVFFLCSPWSNFVHGQVLTVNGGQMTGMTS